METQTKYQPRVEMIEGRWAPEAKLWTPYDSGEIAFVSPAFGSNTYRNVGQEILSKNLKVPTGDYTASLLNSAYCSDASNEQGFKNVRDITKRSRLWVFNTNLWAVIGVYVAQDIDATGRSQPLNVSDLEKALKGGKEINGIRFSKDGKIRFAPKGSYNLEYNAPEAFAKDGFVIASCGEEGAEKLGEVSAKFKNKPYIHGLEVQKGQTPKQKLSTVFGYVDGLRFDGDYWSDGWSHAFGVLK